MSKNNFKREIRDRYKGRGNSWVKVDKDNDAYNYILRFLDKLPTTNYTLHIEREGFAWLRFSKPSGTTGDERCLFELRHRGSKIDHPESIIDLPDDIAITLPLLGNTPVKLQLEILPENRKEVKQFIKKEIVSKAVNDKKAILDIDKKVCSIEKSILEKPTTRELKEWEEFLIASNLLCD